jgi:hypothetical protein
MVSFEISFGVEFFRPFFWLSTTPHRGILFNG